MENPNTVTIVILLIGALLLTVMFVFARKPIFNALAAAADWFIYLCATVTLAIKRLKNKPSS